MASIPTLLTPSNNGTVVRNPYFELYSYSTDPNLSLRFRIKISRIEDDGSKTVIKVVEPGEAGWNKSTYLSNEIAVYTLTGVVLEYGKRYQWQAQSYDGIVWNPLTITDLIPTPSYFNVYNLVGDSDLGIFTVSDDALENITPHLLSVESPLGVNHAVLTERIPTFTWSVPYGLGEGIHFKVKMDVIETFSSRNLLVFESKFDPDLFQMYDGVQWVDFPSTGTVFGATEAKIILPDSYFNDKYYWVVTPEI